MPENNSTVAGSRSTLYSEALLLSCVLSGSIFGGYVAFNRYLKQYKSATEIPARVFRKKWLRGRVTLVGDGDNFHFFHTPGRILGGWYWLRKVPRLEVIKSEENQAFFVKQIVQKIWRKDGGRNMYLNLQSSFKGKRNLPTIAVRLCGVDAPERAHFGNAAQPYSEEALNWLRFTLLGRSVRIKPLSIDQYGRCVAKVNYWTWFGPKNVSLEMIKRGLGIVYEGKTCREFDGEEDLYKYHEAAAKKHKRGVWSLKKFETPGDYKKRIN
ncbi:LAMI_0D10198g1_1 [Lachancea mirantina]|uniref:Probable endonuclease LCL3 n=1 Tax=Lachancea mirantina TaxID=1230905 RepID=A0A1G4JE26_9SACH|nr:LAMI_0D10198g1_1 [Lachancea mirantina]